MAIRLITQESVHELTQSDTFKNKCLHKKGASIETFSCLTVGNPWAVNRGKIYHSGNRREFSLVALLNLKPMRVNGKS